MFGLPLLVLLSRRVIARAEGDCRYSLTVGSEPHPYTVTELVQSDFKMVDVSSNADWARQQFEQRRGKG